MQGEVQQLVVDRASAAVSLDDEATRDWARDKRVFISSVMDGQMKPYRVEGADAVRDLGAEPILFEEFGGRDQDPAQAYLSEVDSADVYVGILGTRYGRQAANGFSSTHAEYLRATQRSLRISIWNLEEPDMEGHQRSFLDEVRQMYTTEAVDSPGQFRAQLTLRLRRIASEDASPWVKLGSIVFRAQRIEGTPTLTTIEAKIKDPAVSSGFSTLRERRWGGSLILTYGDQTLEAQVKEIKTLVRAGASQTLSLALEHRPDHRHLRSSSVLMSVNTQGRQYSPSELTQLAVADQLLGQSFPEELQFGRPQLPEFGRLIRDAQLSEETIRPILRLLLVEALVGSGRVARITRVALGPRTLKGRHAIIEWHPADDQSPVSTVGRVEGLVAF